MKRKFIIIFIILIIFLLGIYIGLAINYPDLQEKDTKIRELYIEIDSLKETIYMQQLENKKGD